MCVHSMRAFQANFTIDKINNQKQLTKPTTKNYYQMYKMNNTLIP